MEFDSRLLVKYMIEELTPTELEELMAWKNQSEENEKIFRLLIGLRISHRFLLYNTPDRIENALKKVNHQVNKTKKSCRINTLMKYVALFLLLITLAFGGWYSFNQPESYLHIVMSDGEDIKKINLDDGSVVWLNKGASLRIPDSFSASNRRVIVIGEAYFEVKKDPESPFWVEGGQLKVKVLGTSFNINTGTDGDKIETILVSGKVSLLDKNQHFLLDMSPGEKVSYTPGNNQYVVEAVDAAVSTSWHLGQLTFESATLREIVNKLSLLYDVHVNLESKALADIKFRCVINREEGLAEVLELLKYMVPFEYHIEEKEVFIYEPKK